MKRLKIGIIAKNTEKCLEIKSKLCTYLLSTGDFELIDENDCDLSTQDLDKILVFGGDGTMLSAAKIGSKINAPVLGINLGHVGFLAQVESTVSGVELAHALRSDDYFSRFLLDAHTDEHQFVALNDIIIKSKSYKPIVTDLYVDDAYVDSYHSDGLIIATPTGSTAYSLSAQGPIIAPDVDALIINPVCPHSLHSRPFIINGTSKINITVRGEVESNLIIDGEAKLDLREGQEIQIVRSHNFTKFIGYEDKPGFYKKLLDKMNRWGTTIR